MAADARRRCRIAAPNAWRGNHAHIWAQTLLQLFKQLATSRHRAGQCFADAHRELWRRGGVFFDHVEVVVERGDLVDLAHRQLHLLRQRNDVGSSDMSVAILDTVQKLDEQIPPPWRISQQCLHFSQRFRVDHATFGRGANLALGPACIDDRDDRRPATMKSAQRMSFRTIHGLLFETIARRPAKAGTRCLSANVTVSPPPTEAFGGRLCAGTTKVKHVRNTHYRTERNSLPISAGLRVTLMPHSSITANFSCAVPLPPEMMAPA